MSIRDEFAQEFKKHSMRSWDSRKPADEQTVCQCGWVGSDLLGHQLNEVSKRFGIVELPEPDYHGCWPAGGRARVTVTSEGRITDGYAVRETPAEARALAAALLAAANRAEAQQ